MVNRTIVMEYGDLFTGHYGAIVTNYSGASAPERDRETIEVPGRNGNLSIDGGRFKNIDITYSLFFPRRQSFLDYRTKLVCMKGYQKLRNSYEPNEYRLALVKGQADAEIVDMHAHHTLLKIVFDCKPQRFLVSGDIPVEFTKSDERALINQGSMPSKPLIRVYGTGTLGVGGHTITIAKHGSEYVDIDSDIQDCFCKTANLNQYITLSNQEFPELNTGITGLSLGTGITKVIITPRWWML